MKIGITMITTDTAMNPVELAIAAEERGFSSMWVPEHTHIPVSRRTPAPTGEPLDEWYKRMLDPYVTLGAIAAATSTLRIGTGVALPAQHHPLAMAKQVATVDHLCGGRLSLGIGFGWNAEEMAQHGVDFATRRERVAEHIAAMRALWTEDEASFDGEFVQFEPSWSWPKPVQPGGPPVLIGGGGGPKLFDAIATYADGWIPIGGSGLAAGLEAIRGRMDQLGRDPSALEVVPFGSLPSPEKLDYFRSLGVTEVVLRLPSAGRDEVLAELDRFTKFL